MALSDTIDKVVVLVKAELIGTPAVYTLCKGVYYGDQEGFSAYPVVCVCPSKLGGKFPVIARQTVRDEEYTLEIVAYVKVVDTAANAKQIITMTDSIRTALLSDLQLSDYVYQSEIYDSDYFFGSKGDILLRCSVTQVKYIKRISP